MRRVFAILLILIALTLILAACSGRATRGQIQGADAAPDAVPDLIARYALNGIDVQGAEYGGTLAVTAGAAPEQYQLQWIVTESLLEGVGKLDGNKLRVQWQTLPGSPSPLRGTAIYTITTKGEFYGTREIEGVAGAATEKAFPNRQD